MKNAKYILAILFGVLLLSGCRKDFDKHYDLAVDAESYTLPYTGDSFPLYVYCSGTWTARFTEQADWITMEPGTESGKGNGLVRITYKDNDVATREITLVLTSGKHTKEVKFTQKYNSSHLEVL